MKNIEIIAHWVFSAFMAIISYFASLLFFIYIMLKIEGLPFGGKMPADFYSQVNPNVFAVIAFSTGFLPLMIASFMGAVTAPNSKRRIASIVFPVLVFLAVNLETYAAGKNHSSQTNFLLESAACCAVVGAVLYFRSKRRPSKGVTADS